jgi:hypothetical protein
VGGEPVSPGNSFSIYFIMISSEWVSWISAILQCALSCRMHNA